MGGLCVDTFSLDWQITPLLHFNTSFISMSVIEATNHYAVGLCTLSLLPARLLGAKHLQGRNQSTGETVSHDMYTTIVHSAQLPMLFIPSDGRNNDTAQARRDPFSTRQVPCTCSWGIWKQRRDQGVSEADTEATSTVKRRKTDTSLDTPQTPIPDTIMTQLLRLSRWASVSRPTRSHWAHHSSFLFSFPAAVSPPR